MAQLVGCGMAQLAGCGMAQLLGCGMAQLVGCGMAQLVRVRHGSVGSVSGCCKAAPSSNLGSAPHPVETLYLSLQR